MSSSEKTFAVVAFIMLGLVASPAFALSGGFATATSTATQIRGWLYGIVAVVGAILLLMKVIECKSGRATWSEVGGLAAYIALAGGSIALVTELYSWFA